MRAVAGRCGRPSSNVCGALSLRAQRPRDRTETVGEAVIEIDRQDGLADAREIVAEAEQASTEHRGLQSFAGREVASSGDGRPRISRRLVDPDQPHEPCVQPNCVQAPACRLAGARRRESVPAAGVGPPGRRVRFGRKGPTSQTFQVFERQYARNANQSRQERGEFALPLPNGRSPVDPDTRRRPR